jgi:hypothetical protein
VRLLRELENKKGKLSRNQLAVSLIEKGLTDDEMMKSVVEEGRRMQDSRATNQRSQATTTNSPSTTALVANTTTTPQEFTKEVVEVL